MDSSFSVSNITLEELEPLNSYVAKETRKEIKYEPLKMALRATRLKKKKKEQLGSQMPDIILKGAIIPILLTM